MEKIEKVILGFKEQTVKSAVEGFVVESNNELTDKVKDYLNTLGEEDIKSIQKFLNKLLNLCYDGKLFDMDIDPVELEMIKSLTPDKMFLFKETIIYFSGRLSVPADISVLKKAYQLDDDKYIKLNITFTTLSSFNEDVELDFVGKIEPGNEYDIMIRSWTMAFFMNVTNPYEYRDGNDDWSVAKNPRIKRLAINDELNPKFKKAMSFRLLDLVVIYLFLENRKADSLTEAEKEIIKNANIDYESYSEKKKSLMLEYKNKILNR